MSHVAVREWFDSRPLPSFTHSINQSINQSINRAINQSSNHPLSLLLICSFAWGMQHGCCMTRSTLSTTWVRCANKSTNTHTRTCCERLLLLAMCTTASSGFLPCFRCSQTSPPPCLRLARPHLLSLCADRPDMCGRGATGEQAEAGAACQANPRCNAWAGGQVRGSTNNGPPAQCRAWCSCTAGRDNVGV